MATLSQQLERSKSLSEKTLTDDLFRFIKTIERKLIDYNVNQLNVDSRDINGKPIGFYSYATEMITNGRKSRGEPFNAKETGSFLSSFFIDIRDNVVRFGSSDSKTFLILTSDDWLSNKLFGLTENNLRQFIKNDILPFILQHQRKVLQV